MLELNLFRNKKDKIVESFKKRNLPNASSRVDQVLQLDDLRKSIQTELDQLKATLNQKSKEVGTLFKSGQVDEANRIKDQLSNLKDDIKNKEDHLRAQVELLNEQLFDLPNLLDEEVPAGNSENDNVVFKDWDKELPVLADDALPHWELAKKYDLLHMDIGAKLSGAGFPVFSGSGARLQRALISFFLDEATAAGYKEFVPPLLVNEDTARATGQLPDKEGQMYFVEKDNLYLIPTSEVPLTNIYRDSILDESDFPIKITGYTPCFRREAGSYGSEVKGLNRVHQFDKIEIVRIEHPDHSYLALDEMIQHVSHLLEKLELPYRILLLCGGDTGFVAAKTFDFEVYSAAQKRWLEVSSVSNFETYQANRLKLRFRQGKDKQLAHTLNGSALALARIIAAILENGQTEAGIRVPKVLQKYMNTELIEK